MLNITKRLEEDIAVYKLEGRLDTVTSPELTKELEGTLDSVGSLVFDFEKLTYISSAGLRVLLATQKELMGRGTMKVIHVNEIIMEVFEITGFTDILNIEQKILENQSVLKLPIVRNESKATVGCRPEVWKKWE